MWNFGDLGDFVPLRNDTEPSGFQIAKLPNVRFGNLAISPTVFPLDLVTQGQIYYPHI